MTWLQPKVTPPPDRFLLRLLVIAIVFLPWLVPWRHLPAWYLTTVAAAVMIGQYFFHYRTNGNWGWYESGFVYGTDKFPKIGMGAGIFSNLPVLLTNMHWISGDIHEYVGSIVIPFYGEFVIDRRTELAIVYMITLFICSAAAAIHSRRNDPRILIALAAPWVLFPALMPQMSERYLLMSSAISAAVIGASGGLTFVHLLLGFTGALMTMDQIRTSGYGNGKIFPISDLADSSYPNSGWIVVAAAAVFLVACMLPSRRLSSRGAWPTAERVALRLKRLLASRTRALVDFFAPLAYPMEAA
jgi:hypothetical protein